MPSSVPESGWPPFRDPYDSPVCFRSKHFVQGFRFFSHQLIVALIAARQFWLSGVRSAPIEYRTAFVERGPIVSVVDATGTINPVTTVQVGALVTVNIGGLHADFTLWRPAGVDPLS